MFRLTVLTVLLAVFAPTTRALAQTDSLPAIGTRVRVMIPASGGQSDRYVVGRFVRFNEDGVVLLKGDWGQAREDTLTLELEGGRRLERPVDGGGYGQVGALLGGVVGALSGAAIASASWTPCAETGLFRCMLHPSRSAQASLGALAGATGGVLLGGIIGNSVRHTTWTPVHGAQMHIMLAPGGTGLGIRVAL